MTSDNVTSAPPSSPGDPPPAWMRWVEPQRLFPVFALVFGLTLTFLTAPFQVPDEAAHFYRAYQVSEGQFLPVAQEHHGGADLPESLEKVAVSFDPTPRLEELRVHHPSARQSDVKVSWAEIRQAAKVPLKPDQRKFTRTVAAMYSPASYIPQAAAIFLGRHFVAGPLVLMYMGRIANLLFWAGLCYLALRITPSCRRPLLLLLLMPMTLFQAASLSADPTANALAVLFTAMVLGYVKLNGGVAGQDQRSAATPDRIGAAACMAFVVVTAMLALTKFVYLPLLALVFLIPPSRLGGPKRYFLAVGILGIVGLVASLSWTVPVLREQMVVRVHDDVKPDEQQQYLRDNPTKVLSVLALTLSHRGWFITRSFVGRLGRLDTTMSHLFTDSYLIAMFAACWLEERRLGFLRRFLTPIVLIPVAISVIAIVLLNYKYDNIVKWPFAEGVQGRYLIPLAPAIIVLLWGLAPRWPRSFSRQTSFMLNVGVAVIVSVSCIYTVIAIWQRYYGHPFRA